MPSPPAGRGLVFVGERRSRRARQLNASWSSGGLAASTLHAALRACGIESSAVLFVNLFQEGDGALVVDPAPLAEVRVLAAGGATVVALGRAVQRRLARSCLLFVPLTQPAARGRIRTRAMYQAHVADVLRRAA
jgi:hypothetical protein